MKVTKDEVGVRSLDGRALSKLLLIPIRVLAYNFAGKESALGCTTKLYARTQFGISTANCAGVLCATPAARERFFVE